MGWLERIGFLGSRRRRRELGKLESEIGAVTAERDAYLRQRDVALGERNEFLRQRDIAIGERNELLRQRDIALAERNALRHLRETNPEASSLRPERREGSPGLTFLANRFGSDKGDAVGNAHDYTALYSFLLEAWRNDEFQMLELGLQRAAGAPTAYLDPKRQVSDVPSVRMWLEFFPRAHCYGFDCADFTGISVPRFTFIRGDVGNRRDLERLANTLPPLRLIVDDASHASYHQQIAFATLFAKLESNGLYIIEDVDYQPAYEAELPACLKTHEVFGRFLDGGSLALPDSAGQLASLIRNVFVHRGASSGESSGPMKLIAVAKR